MITLEDVIKNEDVEALIKGAQKQLDSLGYTEHSHRHIAIVSERTGEILEKLRISRKNCRTCKNSRIYARYWKLCK